MTAASDHRIVAIIPAHLASVRFPRKILFPFSGLAMIEHVRRRALMCRSLAEVYVATCDDEISDVVLAGGGKVIRTSNQHHNGTSRVAEAVKGLDASHIVLLQGDEPLLLPRHVEALTASMLHYSDADAWNATGDIHDPEELDRHSFVKCSIGAEDRILYCFRRSPSAAPFDQQVKYIRKILGLFSFTRSSLLSVATAPASVVEQNESIEQMRIIESGLKLVSVPVDVALPSVNEPHEAAIVEMAIRHNSEQQALLRRVLEG
jgi:3-deoxy-manno-octulosonate cytidylyltransferase (CMP-KDO synthetase)